MADNTLPSRQDHNDIAWWALGGFVFCALSLWLSQGPPFPTRHLETELKTLAVVYPLGLLALFLHVRRALPEQIGLLTRWFVMALVIRSLFLTWSTDYALSHNPSLQRAHAVSSSMGLPDASRSPFEGYIASDSYTFSLRARLVSYLLTGQGYGLDLGTVWAGIQVDIAPPNQATQSPDNLQAQAKLMDRWQHTVVAGLIISRWGFSVLASCLPFIVLGSFWCILVYTYLYQYVSPTTARWVLLWMVFAPEFLCLSAQWHEDVPSAVCAMWLLHLCTVRLRQRRLLWLASLVGTLLVLRLFRPQLILLLVSILILDASFRLLRRPKARTYGLIASLILVFVGMWHQALTQPGQAIGSKAYPIGFIVNVSIIPGPIYFFGDGLFNKVYAMCDLFQAMAWPLLGGWFLIGVYAIISGTSTISPTCLVCQAAILCAATVRYPGEYGAMRLKLMAWPLMLAVCFEAIRVAQQAPEATRRRLASLTFAYTMAMIALHLVAVCNGVVGGG